MDRPKKRVRGKWVLAYDPVAPTQSQKIGVWNKEIFKTIDGGYPKNPALRYFQSFAKAEEDLIRFGVYSKRGNTNRR